MEPSLLTLVYIAAFLVIYLGFFAAMKILLDSFYFKKTKFTIIHKTKLQTPSVDPQTKESIEEDTFTFTLSQEDKEKAQKLSELFGTPLETTIKLAIESALSIAETKAVSLEEINKNPKN